MAESEFGRGLATCLFMFLNHAPRLPEFVAMYARMRRDNRALFDESGAIEVWANGASDHLYELVTGGRVTRAVRQEALAIQAIGLEMGHGFGRATGGHKWTVDEAMSLIARAGLLLMQFGGPLTLEEAMAIDRGFGLRPEAGQWPCPGPVPPLTGKEET